MNWKKTIELEFGKDDIPDGLYEEIAEEVVDGLTAHLTETGIHVYTDACDTNGIEFNIVELANNTVDCLYEKEVVERAKNGLLEAIKVLDKFLGVK